jgi:hypothetical protein
VGDELPVPRAAADGHGLQGLGDGADLVEVRHRQRRHHAVRVSHCHSWTPAEAAKARASAMAV